MALGHKQKIFNKLHVVIMLLLMVGGQFLPTIGTITPLGMKILGIFFGTVYGWSTLGMIWPSFISLTFLSTLPDTGAIATFKTGFGDRVTVAVFFLLLFGELVTKVGLSKYIADWCVRRKFVQGKPFGLLIMFCFAGAVISACVNVFAAIILMLSVYYSFCKEVGLRLGDRYARYSLVAIIYVATMAGDIFPFMGTSVLVVGIQERVLSMPVPYVQFALAQIALVIMGSIIYLLYLRIFIKPDASIVKAYRPEKIDMRMGGQKSLLRVFCFVCWWPSSFLASYQQIRRLVYFLRAWILQDALRLFWPCIMLLM